MSDDVYLVLRVKGSVGAPDAAFDPTKSFTRGVASEIGDSGPPEVRIDAENLTDPQYRDLRRDPEVAGIARPIPVRLIAPVPSGGAASPPEPVDGATWGVHVTGAAQCRYTGSGITVGVLDTGIDAGHEAFQGIELIQKDFTGEGDADRDGHGTHVAGTLFGQTLHGVRYAIAPGIRRAVICKVIGKRHSASTKEIVAAVQWAVDQGAQLINLSLGFDFPGLVKWWTDERGIPVDLATSRALAEYRDNVRLFDRLVGLLQAQARQANSALLIAAAGNESKREKGADYVIEAAPPAAAEDIVAVGALESAGPPHRSLQVARFSNIRPLVAAPGVGIYSVKAGGGYTFLDGTSMASPHATGIAALWAERQLARTGQVNPGSIAAQLRANARRDNLPQANYLDVGEGLVSAPRD